MLATESAKNLVPKFFDKTSVTYDKVVRWTTFGKDRYWKKEILKQIPEVRLVLDLGCGTGILSRKISEKFPNAKIVGVDITPSFLKMAKRNSKLFPNISFIHQDAETLNLGLKFDCITSSYIPKYCNPEILVKNCVSHLNSGGKIIFHDFTCPKNILIRMLWNVHFIFLNFVGHFMSNWKKAFSELPKLIRTSTWLNDYANTMKKNGLEVRYQYLTLDSSAILIGIKNSIVKS